jgi:hypothetical protein
MNPGIVGYVAGCVGFLAVESALAQGPAPKSPWLAVAPTPAGCTDSRRGRTHVLRFCGADHYWIKVTTVPNVNLDARAPAVNYGGGGPGTTGTVSIPMNR